VPVRRFPPIFLLYVGITVAQAVIFVIADGDSISGLTLPFEVFLVVGLAYGQPWAWGILLALNTIGLGYIVVLLLGTDSHILVGNAILLLGSTGALEATLLSPPMRRHVAARGLALRRRAPLAG
jgi:hypothetical protein